MPHWELVFFFAFIALIYSSVGFGGGSSYLAVLAMYGLPFKELRLIALLCNIIVVSGGVYIYLKNHQVNWKKIAPLAGLSIPMAYLGAIVHISQNVYFVILGCSLIVAAILLWTQTISLSNSSIKNTNNSGWVQNSVLGGSIGFLSGMVGIGGGIFLSPILNFMRWDVPKKIAATASVFILVNSISGIVGQLNQMQEDLHYQRMIGLCLAVFIGGQIGSRMSIKLNPLIVKRLTALLVLFAGIEILIKHR